MRRSPACAPARRTRALSSAMPRGRQMRHVSGRSRAPSSPGQFVSITASDLSGLLAPLTYQLDQIGAFCLFSGVDDTDVSPEPGLQVACTVSDLLLNGSAWTESVLPRCPDGGGDGPFPCWWVETDL